MGHVRVSTRVGLALSVLTVALGAAGQEAPLLVQGYCGACHSVALVYSQSGDARFWRGIIDLMRTKHNLGPIAPATEAVIIDYLAAQASVRPVTRRAPLHPALLPPALQSPTR